MGPSHHASLESILRDSDTWPRVTLTGSCYLFAYIRKWPDFPMCAAHGGSLLRSYNQEPSVQIQKHKFLNTFVYDHFPKEQVRIPCFLYVSMALAQGSVFRFDFMLSSQNRVKRRLTRRPVPVCACFLHNCTLTLSKVDMGQVGKNVPGP